MPWSRAGLQQSSSCVYMNSQNSPANPQKTIPAEYVPPMSLHRFCEITGLSKGSAWRHEKRGWLRTHLADLLCETVMQSISCTRSTRGADGGGFEPPVPFGTHAFQACTINRSVTHPVSPTF